VVPPPRCRNIIFATGALSPSWVRGRIIEAKDGQQNTQALIESEGTFSCMVRRVYAACIDYYSSASGLRSPGCSLISVLSYFVRKRPPGAAKFRHQEIDDI